MNLKKCSAIALLCTNIVSIARPPSLYNYGNTCYLNATLQALYSLEPFVQLLQNQQYVYKPDTLARPYIQLINSFNNPDAKRPQDEFTALYGINYINALLPNTPNISNLQFFGKVNDQVMQQIASCGPLGQQDSQEFLTTLIDQLTESNSFIVYEADENSLVADINKLFKYTQHSILTCPDSESVKDEGFQPILSVSLESIAPHTPIINVLENHFKPETGIEARGFLDCTKQLKMVTSPEILIVHAKRLSFDLNDMRPIKISTPIAISEQLSLSSITNNPQDTYKLTAVIIHRGTATGGHYISYVKDFTDNKWYECNDRSITHVFFKHVTQESSTNGYMFFYQRTTEPIIEPTLQPTMMENIQKAFKKLNNSLSHLQTTIPYQYTQPSK